jgi:uncharacterized protein (TIGR00661 family)
MASTTIHKQHNPDPGRKKVLICPLDWGIGHATRCIPLVGVLQGLNYEVIIAGAGRSLDFINREHPDIRCIHFPGTRITYGTGKSMVFKMLKLVPKFLFQIWKEHRLLKQLARETGVDLIISDNRYGCWHPEITSIFITHQLDIQVPASLKFMQRILQKVNYFFINHYTECWIPDFEPHHGLAGALSHPLKFPNNSHYIGILSRFESHIKPDLDQIPPSLDILVMLSGPEPQRSILEELILTQLAKVDLSAVVVRGIPDSVETYTIKGNTHVFAHLETPQLYELLARTSLVVCRSGYSSIMDLVTLGKKAILIPTPGQTEQEYLSRYLMDKRVYFSIKQEDFDLLYAMELSKNFHGMVIRNDGQALMERIQNLSLKTGLPVTGIENKHDSGNHKGD